MNRTYTERLEKVIDLGIDLRHQMRLKSENKDAIIRAQAERIKQLEQSVADIKAAHDERIKRFEQSVNDLRIEKKQRVVTPKQKKLKEQYDKQEVYTGRLKQWIRDRNDGRMPEELKS